MITDAIKKEFDKAKRRGWDRLYCAIDLHETILVPDWKTENLTHVYYPEAKELLQELTNRKDVCLILFTCSHPHEIEQYIANFKKDGITFDYINENPEVKTGVGEYGCYDKKFYFNLLFEDKSGWIESEIPLVRAELKKHSLLNKPIC